MRLAARTMGLMAAVLAAWLCACGVSHHPDQISIEALHGSSLSGITCSKSGADILLSFDAVSSSGVFIRLPGVEGVLSEQWTNDGGTIHLAVETDEGLDLGIAPLPGQSPSQVSVNLKLGGTRREAQSVTDSPNDVLSDLDVSEIGGGQLRLTWTERNSGDYDRNGEVNITDLTPIAAMLGQSAATDWADTDRQYWVDGDHNNEINVTDLTPLAASYGNTIAGYNIYRNGDLLPPSGGVGPSAPASDAFVRSVLPRLYNVVVTGGTLDTWVIRPVDVDGLEGIETVSAPQASLTFGGLVSSSATGQFDLLQPDGEYLPEPLRRIFPGDVPDRAILPGDPGLGTLVWSQPGQNGFLNVPTGQLLFADLIFAPNHDLATGALRPGQPFANPGVLGVPDSYLVRASVPFSLPSDGPGNLIANVSVYPNTADGGFYLSVDANMGGLADGSEVHSRLNYALGRTACDFDADGSFTDEAWLTDSDRDCVSDARLDQEQDKFYYKDVTPTTVERSGVVTGIVEQQGQLYLDGSLIRFSELCSFYRTMVTPGSPKTDLLGPSDDLNSMLIGSNVEVSGYELDNGNSSVVWVWEVIRIDDPGMLLTQYSGWPVRPETLQYGASAGSFDLRYEDLGAGEIAAVLTVANAVGLKGVYCELNYDSAEFKFSGYGSSGAMEQIGGPSSVMRDALSRVPSAFPGMQAVRFAESLVSPANAAGLGTAGAPYTGDLVSFFFSTQAEDAPRTLFAPMQPAASPAPTWNSIAHELRWYYSNPGDFNQDGTVDPADLAQIAAYFGDIDPPIEGTIESILDLNADTVIDEDDYLSATSVAMQNVVRYNVYRSASAIDYPGNGPLDGDNPNGAGATLISDAGVELGSALGAARKYFTFQVNVLDWPQPEDYWYWVRPVDSQGNEGMASSLVQGTGAQ